MQKESADRANQDERVVTVGVGTVIVSGVAGVREGTYIVFERSGCVKARIDNNEVLMVPEDSIVEAGVG